MNIFRHSNCHYWLLLYFIPTVKFCQQQHKIVHVCSLSNILSFTFSWSDTLGLEVWWFYRFLLGFLQYLRCSSWLGYFFLNYKGQFSSICSLSSKEATLSLLISIILSFIFNKQLPNVPSGSRSELCVSQTCRKVRNVSHSLFLLESVS